MAILIADQLDSALLLLHYAHTIHSMAENTPGPLWVHYNQEFRIWHQFDSQPCWNMVHPQLYFQLFSCFASSLCADSNPTLSPDGAPPPGKALSLAEWRSLFCKGYYTHCNVLGSCRQLAKCATMIHRCSLCDAPNHPVVQCHLCPAGLKSASGVGKLCPAPTHWKLTAHGYPCTSWLLALLFSLLNLSRISSIRLYCGFSYTSYTCVLIFCGP